MTGLGATSSDVWAIGKNLFDRDFLLFEKFNPLPLPLYPPNQPGCDWHQCLTYVDTRDIACEPGSGIPQVWVVCAGSGARGSSIKAYKPKMQMSLEVVTSDIAALVDSIPSKVGFGDDIWGLAFEKGTHRYLWVNNQTTKKIYKIDLDQPTPVKKKSTAALEPVKYTVSSGMISIFVPLKGEYTVTIVTVQGQTMKEFHGWDENRFVIPESQLTEGMYVVSVRSDTYSNAWKLLR